MGKTTFALCLLYLLNIIDLGEETPLIKLLRYRCWSIFIDYNGGGDAINTELKEGKWTVKGTDVDPKIAMAIRLLGKGLFDGSLRDVAKHIRPSEYHLLVTSDVLKIIADEIRIQVPEESEEICLLIHLDEHQLALESTNERYVKVIEVFDAKDMLYELGTFRGFEKGSCAKEINLFIIPFMTATTSFGHTLMELTRYKTRDLFLEPLTLNQMWGIINERCGSMDALRVLRESLQFQMIIGDFGGILGVLKRRKPSSFRQCHTLYR